MTFHLVKSMNRPLTDGEEARLLSWWEAHPDVSVTDVIDKHEAEFGMPVTEYAIVKAMMKRIPG